MHGARRGLRLAPARLRPRGVMVVVALSLGAVLAGCATATGEIAEHGAVAADAGGGSSPGPAGTPAPAPSIAITPADGTSSVGLDQQVKVAIDTGQIDSVVVRSASGSTPLTGQLGPHSRTWVSSDTLDAGTHYVVQATAHDSGGTSTAQAAFSTLSPAGRLQTDVTPGDGTTVGVGMPIILQFSSPVSAQNQANVVNHIQVQTSAPVEGAWHWFSDSEVHWRPRDFWPTGTQVTLTANLKGVPAGDGIWGMGNWSESFTIGPKHYSVIDAASHEMQVYNNDQLLHTYPVSTGMDNRWPTLSGTLFVQYKLQKVRMKSTSIGIPVNAPGGYDEDVFWDTAISTDGYFIHAAPWSVWAQGSQNVSHGCVNLSTARATEFFNFSQVGDVVVVKNTKYAANFSDGEADWQIPFDQYANSGGDVPAAAPAPSNGGGGI